MCNKNNNNNNSVLDTEQKYGLRLTTVCTVVMASLAIYQSIYRCYTLGICTVGFRRVAVVKKITVRFSSVHSLWIMPLGVAIDYETIICLNVVKWYGKNTNVFRSWCYIYVCIMKTLFTPQPSGLEGYCRHGPGGRAGGRAGGCQTCGTHISVTAWWIFSVRSSMELSRPVVVHCHAHLPICPIWACPWAKNLSNLPQIGSRLCGSHISETAGWIYPI